MESERATLEQVKAEIDRLGREDRAMLRPLILARYEVRGERQRGFVSAPPHAETR
jgi:hypothetical protein